MYNQTNTRGVNEDALNKLIVDIIDYKDKIVEILNQISDLIDDTQNYYKCDAATDFRTKFDLYKSNFLVASENIKSYTDELMAAKKDFDLINEDFTRQFKNDATKVSDEISIYQEKR